MGDKANPQDSAFKTGSSDCRKKNHFFTLAEEYLATHKLSESRVKHFNVLVQPFSFMTRCFTLPDLFAGKMHALVFRSWKNRIKGRDWYDFEWYVRKDVVLDFRHLQERIKEFNSVEMTREEFIAKLKEKLATTDIEMVKRDVLPFVKHPEELAIWSNDYFLQLAGMMKFR